MATNGSTCLPHTDPPWIVARSQQLLEPLLTLNTSCVLAGFVITGLSSRHKQSFWIYVCSRDAFQNTESTS